MKLGRTRAAAAPAAEDGWKKWNPEAPTKFNVEQKEALRRLHERFTRTFSARMVTLLRGSQVRVEQPQDIQQYQYGQYVQQILQLDSHGPDNFVATVVAMESSDQAIIDRIRARQLDTPYIVVSYDRRLIFGFIDRRMGGTGSSATASSPHLQRALSSVEQRMLSDLNNAAVEALRIAWEVIDPQIKFSAASEDAGERGTGERVAMKQVNQIAQIPEVTAELRFTVSGDALSGNISIGFPYDNVEPWLDKLSTEQFETAKQTPEMRRDIIEALDRLELGVEVRLGHAQLTYADLLALEEGHMVELDRELGDLAPAYVGHYPRFLTSIAKRSGRLVAVVERVLDPEEQDFALLDGTKVGHR